MRRGFTLIEVLVALALAGVAVTTAASIYNTTSTVVEDLAVRGSEWSRDATWRVWLGSSLAGAEVNVDRNIYFRGSTTTIEFQGWALTSGGWATPSPLVTRIVDGRLELIQDAQTLVLADSVAYGAFAYLPELGAGAAWLPSWDSNTSVPRAVRLVLATASSSPVLGPKADTLVFVVGERG